MKKCIVLVDNVIPDNMQNNHGNDLAGKIPETPVSEWNSPRSAVTNN